MITSHVMSGVCLPTKKSLRIHQYLREYPRRLEKFLSDAFFR
jgi:hypothetical protein